MFIIPLKFLCVTHFFHFLKTSYFFTVNSLYFPLFLQYCLDILHFFYVFDFIFLLLWFSVFIFTQGFHCWLDLFWLLGLISYVFDSCFYPFSSFFSSFCKYASLFGCSWLWNVISPSLFGFCLLFCVGLWSLGATVSKGSGLNSPRWKTEV